MALLDQVKEALGLTGTDKDSILTYIGNVVSVQVKRRCRIVDVSSDEIVGIMTDMVVDRYRARGYGQEAAPQTVTGVTEGSTTVNLKTAIPNATMELTDAEIKRLEPYRKLWY